MIHYQNSGSRRSGSPTAGGGSGKLLQVLSRTVFSPLRPLRPPCPSSADMDSDLPPRFYSVHLLPPKCTCAWLTRILASAGSQILLHNEDTKSMSSSNATPPHDSDGQSEAKRRRLRKGTHSCWECKRRKMKCIFDPAVNICNGCRRRGSQCLSQEFPDVVSSFTSNTPVSSSPNFAADGIVGVPVPSAGRDGNFSNQIRPTAPITPASTPALAFLTSSQVRVPAFLKMMDLTDTILISRAPSRTATFNPVPIRLPNMARMRSSLVSCMNLSLPEKIWRRYAQLAVTLPSLLSSPMRLWSLHTPPSIKGV